MTSSLRGKTIIVTGAASGIGRATAVKLDSLGAILCLCDIQNEALNRALSDLSGTSHTTFECDVSISTRVDEIVQAVHAKYKRIDGLFNCAGINSVKMDLEDMSLADISRVINVNLVGTILMTRACIPHLPPGAAIVNVSSDCGLRGRQSMSVYCATKFGVGGFTKALALELGPRDIRVNAIAPGPIDTPTMQGNVAKGNVNEELKKKIGLRRIGTPEEVADLVAFLFSQESSFMNGSIVEIHGGLH